MTAHDQLELITRRIESRANCVIAPLNVHGLRMLQREPAMLKLHRAVGTHVVIDGMPIVALCRLAGLPVRRAHRVTNLDIIWPLLSLAEKKGWRVYYVGSSQDVLTLGLQTIRDRLPSLDIRGHHGFIGMECPDVIADIAQFDANIVMVGMGTGLQDSWVNANVNAFPTSSVMCVGALIEYIAGTVRTPPRWMGTLGLEWLFRLVENPKRFWRRYLIEPWQIAWTLAGQLTQRADRESMRTT